MQGRTEHEAAWAHGEALDWAFGPSAQAKEMMAQSEAECWAEDAWLRWAEGGSPVVQQMRDEDEADLARCGEPGLNASMEDIAAWRRGQAR
jgi:hypothetical protein